MKAIISYRRKSSGRLSCPLKTKVLDAMKTLPKDKAKSSNAAKGVACDKLFHLEKQFASLSPEDRLKERTILSEPIFSEFYRWIESHPALPKTLLGRLCTTPCRKGST